MLCVLEVFLSLTIVVEFHSALDRCGYPYRYPNRLQIRQKNESNTSQRRKTNGQSDSYERIIPGKAWAVARGVGTGG